MPATKDKNSWATYIFDNTVVHEKKENPSYVERKNHFQGSVSCVGGRTLCLSQTVRHGGSSIDLGVATMAIQVVEFSNGGYKIRKIFV